MKRTASIRFKILFLVLAVTLTSIVIISLVSISTIRDALNSKAMQQLVSIREIQKSALQNQFTTYRKQLLSMAQSSFAIEAMKDFRESFKTYPEAVSILEGSKDLRQKSMESLKQSVGHGSVLMEGGLLVLADSISTKIGI